MIKKNKIFISLSVACWSISLFINCNRSPVGFDQLDRELSEPINYEFNPMKVAAYEKYVPNGSSLNLILGKNSEYESRVVLKFPLIDSALSSVTAAKLVLYTKRQNSISFNVHFILEDWQENGVSWVRTDSANYWFNSFQNTFAPGGYFSTNTIGEGQITKDSTVVELALNSLDTLVRSYGLILLPQAGNNGFGLFHSNETSKKPKIVFEYSEKKRIFTASDDASLINIDTTNLRRERNDLWIGAGYAYHTFLKFNLDTIPEVATIAHSELILHPAASFLLTDTVEIGVHRLLSPYTSGLTPNYYPNISAKISFTKFDTVIKIDLKHLVQFWSLNRDSNFGFILKAHPDYSDIFRLELKTDLTNYPRLKVVSILPPERRF